MTTVSASLPSPSLDLLKKPANWPTIELAINSDLNILYFDHLHDKNITNLLEALAKNACDALLLDKNIVSAMKKRTRRKIALLLDKNIALAKKKKIWRKGALLLNKDAALVKKKKLGKKEKCA